MTTSVRKEQHQSQCAWRACRHAQHSASVSTILYTHMQRLWQCHCKTWCKSISSSYRAQGRRLENTSCPGVMRAGTAAGAVGATQLGSTGTAHRALAHSVQAAAPVRRRQRHVAAFLKPHSAEELQARACKAMLTSLPVWLLRVPRRFLFQYAAYPHVSVLQERGSRLSIAFEPLHARFGAEVHGADLTKPLSDDEKALLQACFAGPLRYWCPG